ncbi:MauE/DoxX family redox-associated membrane protein [Chryseobacterium indoltheticum]|uniref:MauE/DoxX family redox-associated membrane protein n=1 Tax=Chryseobacterium indoltheticum TaxID=254 RepID=UPI003F494FDF
MYANAITYGILTLEFFVCFLLIFDKTRYSGLLGSYILMVLFTVYIYLILNFSDFVPCSCGGILEKMDWNTHLIFNILCILFATIAILIKVNPNKRTRLKTALILIVIAIFALPECFLHKRSEKI